ncbi:MAG: DUF2062 domain-containing protein [Chitinophagaceae bacterium]
MNSSISHTNDVHTLFEKNKVCILLPTYNNEKTIADVIEQSLAQTSHVIVVNDGSTDNTENIIKSYPVQLVQYKKNKGKGFALRQGFNYALQQDYQYAITIDTDGQHFPSDCVYFLEAIAEHSNAIMIGARNMTQENVPGKSSFGNKFSNFWFKVETGKTLPDTQSGFRLYPIYQYKKSKWFTRKYEFEIEVIVRSVWSGIEIIPIPIKVFYPKREERISHFRPFKDFSRISVLNTVLVLITFLYIKPRDIIFKPIKEKGLKKGLKTLLFNPNESKLLRASSVGFGVFMGILPIWGFQLLIGIPLAILFKLNKTLFIIAANISIFPPIIWALSLATGKIIFGNPTWSLNFKTLTLDKVVQMGKEFFVGGSVLALLGGLVFFLITLLVLQLKKSK